jgi:hypothetical protein
MRTEKVYVIAKNGAANGFALLMLAIYLAAVVWRGNLTPFVQAVWADFSGNGAVSTQGGATVVMASRGPAFWQWLLALVILYALASNPDLKPVFEPLLIVALVALLIQLATNRPQYFASLNSGIKSIFGGT